MLVIYIIYGITYCYLSLFLLVVFSVLRSVTAFASPAATAGGYLGGSYASNKITWEDSTTSEDGAYFNWAVTKIGTGATAGTVGTPNVFMYGATGAWAVATPTTGTNIGYVCQFKPT